MSGSPLATAIKEEMVLGVFKATPDEPISAYQVCVLTDLPRDEVDVIIAELCIKEEIVKNFWDRYYVPGNTRNWSIWSCKSLTFMASQGVD